ncbi:putative ATP-dependent RNA helicase DDX28 [Merluccius polli]|uniref:ATP-dependent RNA helicase n=1 Tax=Merluccius polli TaxID=89951 RepID=A0AA47N1K8_MERPO|nr:putative ATP-dependent RNA helicase DDX28 [Merluccius polli]
MHSAKVSRLAGVARSASRQGRDYYGGTHQTRQTGPPAPPTTQTTVIRVPQRMQRRVASVQELRGRGKVPTVRAVGPLLIQSKRPQHDQAASRVLGRFERTVLASGGWKHRKSFGDHFAVNSTRTAPPFVAGGPEKEEGEGRKAVRSGSAGSASTGSWSGLWPRPGSPAPPPCSCRPSPRYSPQDRPPGTVLRAVPQGCTVLRTILQGCTVLRTVPQVQSSGLSPRDVLKGHNVLCAAETGSGKTLAYLLPVVHRLQAGRPLEDEADRALGCLVLVPSRELAEQVASVSRLLCAPFRLWTKTVGGGRGVGPIKATFRGGAADVLVATPGALVKALRRRCVDLSALRFVVVDEADTMFDPSFSGMLESILRHADVARAPRETQGPGGKAQLLVVGATFPGGVGEVLGQVTDLGSVVTVKSRNLHLLMPHVKQTFLKVRGRDKLLELQQVLKELQHEKRGGGGGGDGGGGGVLVFCNKATTVNWLGYALDELQVKHLRLQGEMPSAVRTGIFRSFQKGAVDVLVCTDIASRGLDTSRVRLVVNYDCPESTTDYIHRAGRVGRAGGVEEGQVLSFVTHPWDVELVQAIETSARRRSALPGMRSAISQPKAEAEE